MPVVTLDYNNTVISDTYVIPSNPNAGYPKSQDLGLSQPGSFAFMQVKLDTIPNNAVINSAHVVLYSLSNSTGIVDVYKVTSPWVENDVRANNMPLMSQSPYSSVSLNNSRVVSLDITSIIQESINDGNHYGFAITSRQGISNTGMTFASIDTNTTANRPKFIIDYSIPTHDKKQVEYVGGTVEPLTGVPADSKVFISYPEGTRQGDTVLVMTYGRIKPPLTPNGFTVLYEHSGRVLKSFYKTVGTENGFELETAEGGIVNALNITTFRNVKDILRYTLAESTSDNQYSEPVTMTNIPTNSLVLSLHNFYIRQTVTKPANTILFNSHNSVTVPTGTFGISLSVLGMYNHKRTSIDYSEHRIYYGNYSYSSTFAIVMTPVINTPPDIDGTDEFLGSLSSPLVKNYFVYDKDGEAISIVEKVDGQELARKSGEGSKTLDLTSIWDSLTYGKHTITIETNDTYNNPPHHPNVRTWTFLKTLPGIAESPELIKALENTVPILQGRKREIARRVGVPESTKMEDIISNIMGYRRGVSVSSSEQKNFPYAPGSNTNAYYITIDTTKIGFRPKHIIIWGANKAVVDIHHWFDFAYFETGNYKTSHNSYASYFRIPFVSGNLELPVGGISKEYEWIALSE